MATKVRTYRIDIDANANVWDAIVIGEDWWMTAQHLWTSASKDVWTSAWNVPVLNEDWMLPDSTIPSGWMKKSVYDPNNKEADAFDYNNLDNTPEIPEVYDPVITFTQWWVEKWHISLNQQGTATIELAAWWVSSWKAIDITNNVVNVKYDDTTIKLEDNKLKAVVDSELKSNSELPVQNKVVKTAVDNLDTHIWQVDAKFADFTKTADLADVALSNDYDDLDNKPYIPDVIDNLVSSAENKALSANQWRILKWMIDDIAAIGNFLSIWNSTTWQPVSFPKTTPYTYHTWDYYLVWVVWDTNYKPAWASYDWTASSTVESWEVAVWDMYVYDGVVWILQMNHGKAVSFANLTWSPYDNTALAIALNSKADISVLADVATSGSYNDLEDKPTIPTVNNPTITVKKNGNLVESFTLNQSSNKDIDISVPTAVADLSDANDYAKTADLWAVATSNSYTDLDDKPSIPPFLSAWNAVDISGNRVNVVVDNDTIKVDANNKLYYNNSNWYITKDVNDLTNYTKSADLATVATSGKSSDLDNDAGFIDKDVNTLTNYYKKADTYTKTEVDTALNTKADKSSLWAVATSNDYDDLDNKPAIPSKTSDITNDSWFITDSAINTKTFYLSSTSDLTTANAALEFINAGNDALIYYWHKLYTIDSKTTTLIVFKASLATNSWTSYSTINQAALSFTIANNAVTAITESNSSLWRYLETDRNYTVPFTPTANWHPATKKYVDDVAAGINSAEWWNITWTLSDQTDLANALNGKQATISDLETIRSNASAGKNASDTIWTYWNIVTHNTSEFATSAQWGLADTALQPNDNISELTNDAWFITNLVNDLANYYLKTEVYTKAQVDALITNFWWFEVVSVLPTTDIKTTIIYLLWPIWTWADKYEEWIYSNNAWVQIWETSVDLSNYFNKTTDTTDDITEGTNKFVTTAEKNTWSWKQDAISDLATIRSWASAWATALQPNDNISELTNDAWFITSAALPSKTSDLTNDSWFITSSALPTKVSQLQNDAWYTSNTGTITSVKMNGTVVSSSWEADLWTVITAHQDISGKQNVFHTTGGTAPSNPSAWDEWYDTTNSVLKVWNWTEWTEVWSWGWWAWDMLYADFEFVTKSWASITLDLSSDITPSANFTVNVPSEIKEWQAYVLRVNSWATAYTMTLGSGITNPFWVDLTLTANSTEQFVFYAVSSSALELQSDWGLENVFVTQAEYNALPSSKETNWKTYFIYETI